GLAPTASALGAALKPPGAGCVVPALIEATLAAVLGRSARRAAVAAASAWGLLGRIGRPIPVSLVGAVTAASALVIGAGILANGLGVLRADGPTPRSSPPPAISVGPPATGTGATRAAVAAADPPRTTAPIADPTPAAAAPARPDA